MIDIFKPLRLPTSASFKPYVYLVLTELPQWCDAVFCMKGLSFLSVFLDSFCLGMFQTAFLNFVFWFSMEMLKQHYLGSLDQIPALRKYSPHAVRQIQTPILSSAEQRLHPGTVKVLSRFWPSTSSPSLVYVILPTCWGSSQCRSPTHTCTDQSICPPASCEHQAVACTLGC